MIAEPDVTFGKMLKVIMDHGQLRKDRTGVGTFTAFGVMVHYDISESLPFLLGKEVKLKSVLSELLWFLSGSTNDKDLAKLNGTKRTIWTDNAEAPYWKGKKPGDLGNIYGYQWRKWAGVDQIKLIQKLIKEEPESRRILLQSYGPNQLGTAALPACHTSAQFDVSPNGELSCLVSIRSNDLFLGHPYNIASYALLTHMLAHVHDLKPRMLSVAIGNAHIYTNHLSQVREYLNRKIVRYKYPTLKIKSKPDCITKFSMSDFELVGYNPMPAIPAKMAV